jgi:hypothetical protein
MTLLSEEADPDKSFDNDEEMEEILEMKKKQYKQLYEEKQREIEATYEKKLQEM